MPLSLFGVGPRIVSKITRTKVTSFRLTILSSALQIRLPASPGQLMTFASKYWIAYQLMRES